MVDVLAWGFYWLLLFSLVQFSGMANVLLVIFLIFVVLCVLSIECFELVLGEQVLWCNKMQVLFYRGSQLVYFFLVKGRLNDCWLVGVGMEEDLVFVLVVEDVWGCLSCGIIGLGKVYFDDFWVVMMEVGVYVMMEVVDFKVEGKKIEFCVVLVDENIWKINIYYFWESSFYWL